ncbi:MAG: TRAP transporter permease [Rhizobiaceae bacterium]
MPTSATRYVTAAIAIAMVIFHVVNTLYPRLSPIEVQNIHLGFGFLLVFIGLLQTSRSTLDRAMLLILLAASMGAVLYVQLNFNALLDRTGMASRNDLIVGTVLILCCLEGTRRCFGWSIPIVAVVMIAYAYFGWSGGGVLDHVGFNYVRLIGSLSTYFNGVYGSILDISATIIVLFMIFGGFLAASGAGEYFVRVALQVGQRLRSGPAFAAVVSSALFGSISGSPISNVTTTGTFTIPLMKRHGYSPRFAAATEAVASTGGTFMPPVMGVAAFLMSSITGIPYIEIVGYALIPALLYFASVLIAVHLQSGASGIEARSLVRVKNTPLGELFEALPVVAAFIVIVSLMIAYYPAGYSAVMGTFALAGFVLVREAAFGLKLAAPSRSILVEDAADATAIEQPRLPLWRMAVEGAIDGAQSAARIAVVCGTLGIIVQGFVMTGLSGRVVQMIADLPGESLPFALIAIALVSLVFGMGVPTTGSYVMVAVIGAPVLTALDVPLVAAHLFILYFAMLSGLTPPVGATVLVAAQIAKTGYWPAALTAVGLALPGFILPFLFVLEPALLGFRSLAETVWATGSVALGLVAWTAVLTSFLMTRNAWWESLVLGLSALMLFAAPAVGVWLSIVGLLPLLGVLAIQNLGKGRSIGAGTG